MGDQLSFELHTDADVIAAEVPSERIVELSIVPPDAQASRNRLPLNLALVIDRSGSMSGGKLEYVKVAAAHVVDLLQDQDRVAILAFDEEVLQVSASVAATPQNRAELKARIQTLVTGGSTYLSGGWLAGCHQVAEAVQGGGLNRVLLLTDGEANVGITNLEELGMHAGQLLLRGVSTSTFGVGRYFNEHLLEHMANQGGGKFYYIDIPDRIPEIFQQEFQDLMTITARAVEIKVQIPAGVSAQVLGNWRNELRENVLYLWLGDLAASQTREVYLKLLTPPAGAEKKLSVTADLIAKAENDVLITNQAVIHWDYVPRKDAEQAMIRMEVRERYATVEMADKATEALKLERAGEREQAARIMDAAVLSSAPYLARETTADYQALSARMRRGLDEQERKGRHQEEYWRKQRRR